MPYYAESPFERIVNVHWAEPEEPPDLGTAYCGRYGYGARVEAVPGVITAVPYGPNQFPPMVGTFSTGPNTGPGGERYGYLTGSPMTPTPTLTAGYGLHANGLFLNSNAIQFNNNQLALIMDNRGMLGSIRWEVPMAAGQSAAVPPAPSVPMVIESYTINMEWMCSYCPAASQFGIGISHRVPGSTGLPPPPEPAVILGPRRGGSGSFFYDFKYAQWAAGDIIVTEANQFDPNLGGPALVWSMVRDPLMDDVTPGPWRASTEIMLNILTGLGDLYLWEVIAECQQLPPPT